MSELLKERDQENSNQHWRSLAAWFLGPKAENRAEFNSLILSVLNDYEDFRASYQPVDPPYVTEDVKQSRAFQDELQNLKDCLKQLNRALKDSVPFFSTRYKGHMLWETTIPSMVGYISGLLWNQNNVDSSASPVTTTMEIAVAKQLCQMLGFTKTGDIEPWGHITSCGSLANIEALWAARNLKFYPLALRNALMQEERICLAKETATVYIPRLDSHSKLIDAESWDLLNLDVDEICRLTSSIAQAANVPMKMLSTILDDYTQSSLGMTRFLNANKINSPVFFSPATNHYSWPKSATLLGLGYKSLIQVPVKYDGKQDLRELGKLLENCLKENIPVLALVAIIGTTEESAVDPVDDILMIREKFRKKGLNFCIHADAAWGGYLMTTLLEPNGERARNVLKREEFVDEGSDVSRRLLRRAKSFPTRLCFDPAYIQSMQDISLKKLKNSLHTKHQSSLDCKDFVPSLPLSPYVTSQFKALKHVDTITIDPHKAGYCVYPSGALCYRNGSMRGFITLAAPEVYHGDNDPSVGVFGIEGSKPGAAATSVFLSHKVIGLDKFSHGRILGQCNFGAKLFYCMWMTVAKENDPFICVNFIESNPSHVKDVKAFIIENIQGKSDKEIYNNDNAMQFLGEIGPDALINTFVVNVKNDDGTINRIVDVANAIQNDIFKELSGCVGRSTKRIPMFLTTSNFNSIKYGKALDEFKKRLGLQDERNEKRDLQFLRSTVMNPFQSSNGFVDQIATIFRNVVLNCVSKLKEKPALHQFIATHISNDGVFYAVNIPSFSVLERRYHTILKMRVTDIFKVARLRRLQRTRPSKCMHLRTVKEQKMFNIVRSCEAQSFDCYFARSESDLEMGMQKVDLMVEDVIKFEHFEPASAHVEYPLCQKYFIFGNEQEAYITHVITKAPDFFQIIRLDKQPNSIPFDVLDLGVDVTILGVNGSPLIHTGEMQDPLNAGQYTIKLRSTNSIEIQTVISFHEKSAKLWFAELK